MGLYLCVFLGDDEIEGVEVGSYADYGAFIDKVIEELEQGNIGSSFPTLTLHSDCDGEWTTLECEKLKEELRKIEVGFKNLPPTQLNSDWQRIAAKKYGIRLESLYDCFFDVDGENLIERLLGLCDSALKANCPIIFQ